MLDSSHHMPAPVRVFDISDRPTISAPSSSARGLVFGVTLGLIGWSCIIGSVWAAIALI